MDPRDARIDELEARVEALLARVAELEADNEGLRQRLGRNSENSSLPPSRDDVEARAAAAARRQSQQTRAGRRRKPGKQPGAEGSRLEPVEDPDRTDRHRPVECRGCGRSLAGAAVVGEERRQVHDVPARRYDTTEHVAQSCRCACGTTTKACFPPEAIGTVCWGPRLRAIAAYLRVRHQIPVARVAEILTDLMGAPVSAGWVAGLTVEGGHGLDRFASQLADRLAAEHVVHADETGTRINGDKAWFHVLGTSRLTFLHVHRRRGAAAVAEMGVLARFGGVLVSDRWATYWSYPCRHQVCLAHILRDLAAVANYDGQAGWAEDMTDLVVTIIHKCDRGRSFGWDQLPPDSQVSFRAAYGRIVADGLAANPAPANGHKRTANQRDAYNLAVALRDHAGEVLAFMADLSISPTNNAAERDLRMPKTLHKITGGFRDLAAAQAWARMRSYIETARKHGLNPLEVLLDLFAGRPWALPPLPLTT